MQMRHIAACILSKIQYDDIQLTISYSHFTLIISKHFVFQVEKLVDDSLIIHYCNRIYNYYSLPVCNLTTIDSVVESCVMFINSKIVATECGKQ